MPRVATKKTVTFGDLVAAAFDCARAVSADEETVAALAAGAVARRLAHAHRADLARRLTARRGAHRSRPLATHARAA
jgi:hypothetical protein